MNDYANFYASQKATASEQHNDYSEALFQSIDTIVTERVKRLPYDRTIVATITNADNAYIGAYKVTTDNNTTFTAYSDIKTYNTGERVYIRIIDTQYNQSKIITGKYVEQINIQNTNASDIIEYTIEGTNDKLLINKEFAAQGYYLEIRGVSGINDYAPDQNTSITSQLSVHFYKLIIINDQFIASPITTGYNYIYGVNNGTTVFDYNKILEGQYNIINPLGTSLNTLITIQFTPIQQTVQQYVSARCYITLTSGVIIRSNVFIIKGDTRLSSQYRRFTLNVNQDQFFIFNAKGQRINTNPVQINLTINYINTLVSNATFTNTDSITIESSNNNTLFTALNPTWTKNNQRTATTTLTLRTDASLNKSFLVETLTFKITKDFVEYYLTKDFYFGYQQIDSTNPDDSVKLYLNSTNNLNYYQLKINNLLEAGPGNKLLIGNQAVTINDNIANWDGNALTATTATNLATAPSLSNDNNQLKVTAGGLTSAGITVDFATNANTTTNLAAKPVLANDNNKLKLTIGDKTSDSLTISFATNADKLTTNAGSATRPVYFANGIPVVTNEIVISSTTGNTYDIITTINKIITALNTNVAAASGRTIWQGITI